MSAVLEHLDSIPDTGTSLVYPLGRLRVDPVRLEQDLHKMETDYWIHQDRYNPGIKHWDGIALYSMNGDTQDLRVADRLPVHRTAAGEKCAYICDELLPQFRAPWLRVVFYRLRPGTKIGRHRDVGENRMINGIIRVHIPVVTNPGVVMYVADKPYHFPVGSAWYFDATAYHRVENNGTEDRIHLVIDLKLTPELRELLKPLTPNDRLRLSYIYLHHLLDIGKKFYKFVWTPEGRARIRTRARTVFGRFARASRGNPAPSSR